MKLKINWNENKTAMKQNKLNKLNENKKWNETKHNEMKWNEMKWNEMKWNEMKWNEMKWNDENKKLYMKQNTITSNAIKLIKWNKIDLKWNKIKVKVTKQSPTETGDVRIWSEIKHTPRIQPLCELQNCQIIYAQKYWLTQCSHLHLNFDKVKFQLVVWLFGWDFYSGLLPNIL